MNGWEIATLGVYECSGTGSAISQPGTGPTRAVPAKPNPVPH